MKVNKDELLEYERLTQIDLFSKIKKIHPIIQLQSLFIMHDKFQII